MKMVCLFVIGGMLVLLTAGVSTSEEQIFRAETPKVQSAMKEMEERLNKAEDALVLENLPAVARLVKELDTSCHKVCSVDLSTSKLSDSERREFTRLSNELDYRVDRLVSAAKDSSANVVQYEFEKVRQSCKNCHRVFRRQKGA